jgi:hypothetical protein
MTPINSVCGDVELSPEEKVAVRLFSKLVRAQPSFIRA